MNTVKIRIRDHGPLVVEGPVNLTDGEGNSISVPDQSKSNIALCRCGDSANKPFCDGSHRDSGFSSAIRANPLS